MNETAHTQTKTVHAIISHFRNDSANSSYRLLFCDSNSVTRRCWRTDAGCLLLLSSPSWGQRKYASEHHFLLLSLKFPLTQGSTTALSRLCFNGRKRAEALCVLFQVDKSPDNRKRKRTRCRRIARALCNLFLSSIESASTELITGMPKWNLSPPLLGRRTMWRVYFAINSRRMFILAFDDSL